MSSKAPAPGDIAYWKSYGGRGNEHPDCGGNCGHVAYVERVRLVGGKLAIVISESSYKPSMGRVRELIKGRDTWPTNFLRWRP